MPYSPPQITTAGLSVPNYDDILDFYVTNFKTLFGTSVYLGNDSPDFQLMSILALAAADAYAALQTEYNNRSPNFATGASLSSLVKINGISRKVASFSTVDVTISGTPFSEIDNGEVTDAVFGLTWDLPSIVVIGSGGTVVVTAVCETEGAVSVPAGSVTGIATPTAGWTSVTNAAGSSPGQPVEADSQLRTRQALSVSLPSETILAGTYAAIAATAGVTRYNIDENTGAATNGNATPGHSIQAVVEGGTDLAIATAIFNNRGLGCGTFGLVSVPVTDPKTGVVMNIGFDRPIYVPIYVIANLHLYPGGTSSDLANAKAAIVSYLNSLQIGETVNYGTLVAAAMSVNVNLSRPVIGVRTLFFGVAPAPAAIVDVVMTFSQVAQGLSANVTVNSI